MRALLAMALAFALLAEPVSAAMTLLRGQQLVVVGLPGEANYVTVASSPDGALLVRDIGEAPLVAGPNCTGTTAEVRCALRSGTVPYVTVTTSDGDDRISLAGLVSYGGGYVQGGSGDDVVIGGPQSDRLYGDAGNDRIEGGAGDDTLLAAAIDSRGPDADSITGGEGTDTVEYNNRGAPLHISIGDGAADDGAAGEGDDVGADIENVTGGAGADRIIGSDAANVLDGGDGNNEIDGRGGDDRIAVERAAGGRLVGGPGSDEIKAGTGSIVDVRDGEPDTVSCPALERIPIADAADTFTSCVPFLRFRGMRARLTPSGDAIFRVRCHAVGQRCRGRLSVRVGQRSVGRKSFELAPGPGRLRVALDEVRAPVDVLVEYQVRRRAPAASRSPRVSIGMRLERR
jgi:Ca2+-binding RTX toxin-like protein